MLIQLSGSYDGRPVQRRFDSVDQLKAFVGALYKPALKDRRVRRD